MSSWRRLTALVTRVTWANRSTGSAMSVASVVISADRLVAARRRLTAARVETGTIASSGDARQGPAAEQVAPQAPPVIASTTSFTVEPVSRRTLSRASSGTPVKRTARRAVIGWLNGVRGAPKVPGTATSGCSRSHRLRGGQHVDRVAHLRRRPGRRPTGPPPGHPVELGPSWLRIDGERGRPSPRTWPGSARGRAAAPSARPPTARRAAHGGAS